MFRFFLCFATIYSGRICWWSICDRERKKFPAESSALECIASTNNILAFILYNWLLIHLIVHYYNLMSWDAGGKDAFLHIFTSYPTFCQKKLNLFYAKKLHIQINPSCCHMNCWVKKDFKLKFCASNLIAYNILNWFCGLVQRKVAFTHPKAS